MSTDQRWKRCGLFYLSRLWAWVHLVAMRLVQSPLCGELQALLTGPYSAGTPTQACKTPMSYCALMSAPFEIVGHNCFVHRLVEGEPLAERNLRALWQFINFLAFN